MITIDLVLFGTTKLNLPKLKTNSVHILLLDIIKSACVVGERSRGREGRRVLPSLPNTAGVLQVFWFPSRKEGIARRGPPQEHFFFSLVNSSTKLNKKLSFMNEHQKCILQTYKEKYEKTKQELISAQADKVSSAGECEDSNNTKESMVRLEDELRMVGVIFDMLQHRKRSHVSGIRKTIFTS